MNTYVFSAQSGGVVVFTSVRASGSLSPEIQLYTSAGRLINTAYSANLSGGCGGGGVVEMSAFTLPATDTYFVNISDCTKTNSGGFNLYLQMTNSPAGASPLQFGTTAGGSLLLAAQSDTFSFSGTAGDVLDFTATATTGGLSPKFRIFNGVNGILLATAFTPNLSGGCSGSPIAELNSFVLPSSGIFTILVGDCNDSAVGNFDFYLQRLQNPVSPTPLTLGTTQTGSIASAAQSNTYSFNAVAGDRVLLTASTISGALSPKLRLYDDTTGALVSNVFPQNLSGGCGGGPVVEMNAVQLSSTGSYTLLLGDCLDSNVGTYDVYSQLANNPSGANSMPIGGTEVSLIGSAAQSDAFTISLVQNDRIVFNATTTSGRLSPKLRMFSPDGTQLTEAFPQNLSGGCGGGAVVELNSPVIPVSGTYTVLIGDCNDLNSGNYAIYMQRTSAPMGAVGLNFGTTQSGIVSLSAQDNTYSFGAGANAVVDLTMVTTSGGLSPKLRLYKPDGSLLSTAFTPNLSGGCSGSGAAQMNSVTLPIAGNYTLLVGDCNDASSGNYNLSSLCFGTCKSTQTLSSIAISPAALSLPRGGMSAFTAVATYADGSTANITPSVTWNSSNTAAATISASGVLSAIALGTSSVTASSQSITSNVVPVTVTPPLLTAIVISAPLTSIIQGSTEQFTATGTYSDGSMANITSSVNWSSSNTASATVSSGGTATGVSPGAANITASSGNITSNLFALSVTPMVAQAPTVVAFNVLFGQETYDLIGSTRNRLPWQVIGVQVVFSEPVNGNSGSLSGMVVNSFSGSGTDTLNWKVNPVVLGNVSVTLAGAGPNAITNSSGAGLSNGAGFSQAFKVLWGDFNDDGAVTASDMVGVNNGLNQLYNIFADQNGDGVVSGADVQTVRTRLGATLP